MKRHLEPLSVAANITQASFCRLDQVLLTFGYLVMQYLNMTDAEDQIGRDAILRSIEARWARSDQEIFIAAVVLNPFFQITPVAAHRCFTNACIHAMVDHLWRRFYGSEPPQELHQQTKDYLSRTGLFQELESQMKIATIAAEREVSKLINLLDMQIHIYSIFLITSLAVLILCPYMTISHFPDGNLHHLFASLNASCQFVPIRLPVNDCLARLAIFLQSSVIVLALGISRFLQNLNSIFVMNISGGRPRSG
jgi:hypothetical protein